MVRRIALQKTVLYIESVLIVTIMVAASVLVFPHRSFPQELSAITVETVKTVHLARAYKHTPDRTA